jgi:hypothetical protein
MAMLQFLNQERLYRHNIVMHLALYQRSDGIVRVVYVCPLLNSGISSMKSHMTVTIEFFLLLTASFKDTVGTAILHLHK